MPKDFLPHKDSEFLAWSTSFLEKILATPSAFGLVASQSTNYQTLHNAFASSLAVCTDPSSRTRGAIADKNDKRAPLRAEARELARIIQAFPGTTNQMRIDLGLTVRDGEASPINPPSERPVLEVVAAIGRTLKLRLRAQDAEGRAKPDGCDGATLMSFVGATPPADLSAWKFEGSTTRTIFDVEFAPTVPAGAQVWLTAFWFNPRSQAGPACTPISAYIAGGVSGAAAA